MEKIKLGDIFSFDTVYHQKDVEKFAEISGDNNPIHVNQEYASKTPFGQCIVHGFLPVLFFQEFLVLFGLVREQYI